MNITHVFPALLEKHEPCVRRNLSWTKSGPGRRHNKLTARQQEGVDALMRSGVNATRARELVLRG
jgi:hypothetical protein